MPKFEFSPFAENFMEAAGKVYLTQQQIKAMRQKEKLLQDELKMKMKMQQQAEDLKIAEMIFKAKHPEAFESGYEKEARIRAERLEQGLPGHITERNVNIRGMPSGSKGGTKSAGGMTEKDILNLIDKNVKMRMDITGSIKDISFDPDKTQMIIDYCQRLDDALTREEAQEIYDEAMEKLNEIKEQQANDNKVKFFVDTNSKKLSSYKELIDRKLEYEKKLREVRGEVSPVPTTQPLPSSTQQISRKDQLFKLLDEAIESENRSEMERLIDELKKLGVTDQEIRKRYGL